MRGSRAYYYFDEAQDYSGSIVEDWLRLTKNYQIPVAYHYANIKEKEMAKFKIGDKVKVNARTTRTDIPAGTIGTIREVGSELDRSEDEIIYTVDLGGRAAYLYQYKLDKTEKTMEDLTTLEKGDVLVCNSGWAPGPLTVQGVIGGIVFTLNEDSGESDHYSLAELKGDGFELQTEEVLTEVTLDDVASKFGIDVKNLRIKE